MSINLRKHGNWKLVFDMILLFLFSSLLFYWEGLKATIRNTRIYDIISFMEFYTGSSAVVGTISPSLICSLFSFLIWLGRGAYSGI